MSDKFINHNFEGKEISNFATCKYCNQSYLQLVDKKGMLGPCAIGKDKDEQLNEESILLAKAIRLLRDD